MVFDKLMGYDEYSDLDFDASEKVEKETEKICRDNIEDLKRFCVENLFTESDKINLIYYSLSESENYSFWNEFLTKEFLRVFEIAIAQDKMEQLYPLLENITVENIDTLDGEKVTEMLARELDNQKVEIRFNSLTLLDFWLDFESAAVKQSVVSKLRERTKDSNFKIRWNAHKALKDRKIQVHDLNLIDRIRGKYSSTYTL